MRLRSNNLASKFILSVRVNQIDYVKAVEGIVQFGKKKIGSYVCAANVHMLMEAWDNPEFSEIVNAADIITPDGMPLVWMMRLKGVKGQSRVYGPTLMLHVLDRAAKESIPVGFYGSEHATLESLVERMKERFDGLQVVYAYSPPFRLLTVEEDARICAEIAKSGTKVLFVGLGCPRQEIWMCNHRDKVNVTMLGVGAAFDFLSGNKKQAPMWVQRIGLEWLFRFFLEPKRLAWRYLYHNPRFIVLALSDLLGLLKTENTL